jgi:hypothetical protein
LENQYEESSQLFRFIEETPTDWTGAPQFNNPLHQAWLKRAAILAVCTYLGYKSKADLKLIPAILAVYVPGLVPDLKPAGAAADGELLELVSEVLSTVRDVRQDTQTTRTALIRWIATNRDQDRPIATTNRQG